MAATKFSFYVISISDRGDFPRIIVIALFSMLFVIKPCILLTFLGFYLREAGSLPGAKLVDIMVVYLRKIQQNPQMLMVNKL